MTLHIPFFAIAPFLLVGCLIDDSPTESNLNPRAEDTLSDAGGDTISLSCDAKIALACPAGYVDACTISSVQYANHTCIQVDTTTIPDTDPTPVSNCYTDSDCGNGYSCIFSTYALMIIAAPYDTITVDTTMADTAGDIYVPSEPLPGICTPTDTPVVCNELYKPVCGINNVTYSNTCYAAAAGIAVAYEGNCDTASLLPVACTSANDCDSGEICIMTIPLVYCVDTLALDGSNCIQEPTYGYCSQISVPDTITILPTDDSNFNKSYPSTTVCTMEYAPMCGADGVTYSNLCMATASGVAVVSSGECP